MERILKRKIEKIVEECIREHFDECSVEIDGEDMYLSDFFDSNENNFSVESLAEEISEIIVNKYLKNYSFRFKPCPDISKGGSYQCESCMRVHGDFVNGLGNVVATDNLLANNRQILLLDKEI